MISLCFWTFNVRRYNFATFYNPFLRLAYKIMGFSFIYVYHYSWCSLDPLTHGYSWASWPPLSSPFHHYRQYHLCFFIQFVPLQSLFPISLKISPPSFLNLFLVPWHTLKSKLCIYEKHPHFAFLSLAYLAWTGSHIKQRHWGLQALLFFKFYFKSSWSKFKWEC